jgi:hypothetical protein
MRSSVLGHLPAWLFGVTVAVITVGTLAVLYMAEVGRRSSSPWLRRSRRSKPPDFAYFTVDFS